MDTNTLSQRVLWTTLWVNLGLGAFKLAAGLLGRSGAMVSDAVHTLSDVATTVMVMAGLRISRRQRDARHPYGYHRYESLTGLLLAVTLAATAVGIGIQGVRRLLPGGAPPVPGLLPLLAAGLSILCQEGMYRYARWGAREVGSTAMLADAWHHRSDALSSVGSLVGIACARLGLPAMDPVASLVIAVMILKVAWDIGRTAAGQLVDMAADPATVQRIRLLILMVPGVLHIDQLLTRRQGSRLDVDVEIAVNHTLSFEDAHAVAERVRRELLQRVPGLLDATVHANPHHGNGMEVPLPRS